MQCLGRDGSTAKRGDVSASALAGYEKGVTLETSMLDPTTAFGERWAVLS